MLIREAIARIKSLYNRGAASDDTRLSNRHIYSKLKSVRALLIKQSQDRKSKTSPWNVQVIPCLKLQPSSAHECKCVIPSSCTLLRSVCKIPKPIQTKLATGIESVSTLDGSVLFTRTTWAKKRYKSGDRYTSAISDYFIRDNYLYITHNTMLEYASISGIFEDPVDIEEFIRNEECSCGEEVDPCIQAMDKELKMEDHLFESTIQLATQELIQMFMPMSEDNENNAKASETTNEKE
jgi:hypothetical protein